VELLACLFQLCCQRVNRLSRRCSFFLAVLELLLTLGEAALMFVGLALCVLMRLVQPLLEPFDLRGIASLLLLCRSSRGFTYFGDLLLGFVMRLSRGLRCSLDSHLGSGILRRPDQLVAARLELRFELASQ